MQQWKNSYHVGPRAQAVEHGSYLCKSACVPRETPCQKRKVANVLIHFEQVDDQISVKMGEEQNSTNRSNRQQI
ncbi:hypothetical protein Y032_0352g3269 [Ancylostoma ceylanicum]|uniref:Uncharacterized protein n=1 Tax=Ancylostoma ceylanicum TaxID=53326 RepID=A0A016RXB3_9BILA|nr:hypothetical protein Y032_0352g3269 [Ancylostoma ceylanicum]